MKGKVTTGLIRKRSQFAPGHVFLAMLWVPWPVVPDTSPTIVSSNYLECFVLDCKWCLHSVQRGWGGGGVEGVEVTFTKQVSTPVIHILYIWIVITHMVSSYANVLEQKIFLHKKRVQSPQAAFLIFLYTNMAALTSYETALWFKYSSLPLYCKK